MSEVLDNFLKVVNFDVVKRNANSIVLSSLLHHLLSSFSVYKTSFVGLKNGNVNGLFEIGDFHIQMSRKRNRKGNISGKSFSTDSAISIL